MSKEEAIEKLEAANHDYAELMKERKDYIAENKRLRKGLDRIKALSELDARYEELAANILLDEVNKVAEKALKEQK